MILQVVDLPTQQEAKNVVDKNMLSSRHAKNIQEHGPMGLYGYTMLYPDPAASRTESV